ncbi:hypothetical protein SRB5_21840 [Streptomyces sp. RB5]|uniref:Cholesterol esterase n=1 Tax=Streptomyces smaragdinus TaxID=2585196 RepID=A0A7K0CF09_9ACTN|nr:DUF6230 family protein [Streptomyces smaragdinus]MQY12055.1 hypothetical protein [Streptomyces smaragdinus]
MSQVRGGTRWKRFAVVMVPSVAATAAIGVALAQGALAASFAVSGQEFKVTAGKLDGHGMVQYGSLDAGTDLEGKAGAHHPVAVSGFNSAEITNMCQSVVTEIPGLGAITMKLTAGDGGTPVAAKKIYIDSSALDADAEFRNINIGVAAGQSSKGPGIQSGDQMAKKGGFAQEADRAILTDVKQTAWATSAGTFKLSGLKLRLNLGKNECY